MLLASTEGKCIECRRVGYQFRCRLDHKVVYGNDKISQASTTWPERILSKNRSIWKWHNYTGDLTQQTEGYGPKTVVGPIWK